MSKILFTLTICLAIVTGSCRNGNTGNTNKKQTATSANTVAPNSILFKVNGELVKTKGWNISRFDMGKGIQLNITTNMHEDKRTILMNVEADKRGTYALQTGSKTSGVYKPDYADMLNSYSFENGSIVISDIDTSKLVLNATFEGTVKNAKGETFYITDGKVLNGNMQPGIIKY